jgi:hypothetical protein
MPTNAEHSLTFTSAKTFSLKLDEGLAEYEIISSDPSRGYISSTAEEIDQFQIEKDGTDVNFTLFTGSAVEIKHWKPDSVVRVFVSAFLMKGRGRKNVRPGPRLMTLIVDGKRIDFSFNHTIQNANNRIACRKASIRKSLKDKFSLTALAPMAGALVTITPNYIDSGYDRSDGHAIFATGANGWLKYTHERKEDDDVSIFSEGVTDFLVASGKFDSFQIENAAIPTSNVNSLQVFGGETTVRLRNNGVLDVSGEAKALYWNQERVNKTRWEKMDFAERSLIITWLLGLLYICFRLLRDVLSRDVDVGTPL